MDIKYKGYKEYTIDKLLDALKFILQNTYVQFAGNFFKQIQGIPMGGNASPFIADLYLAWHEYCYMEMLVKSKSEDNYKLARQLSLNSRYIDDISVVNYLGFGKIAEEIYHPSLLLECSNSGYHYDTFLDLNIRIHQGNFLIGIYHKVDDFNFVVINYPFPSSNIHSQVGYNTFYSQLVRYFRLCTNVNDFNARVCLIRKKLSTRGYSITTLYKYFLKFCSKYPANLKYGVQDGRALWNLTYSKSTSSCCVYDENTTRAMVKPCKIVLKDVYDGVKSKSSHLLKNCFVPLLDVSLHDHFTKRRLVETQNTSYFSDKCQTPARANSVVQRYEPLGLQNPRNHCYLNSSLQVLQRLLFDITDVIHVNDNLEGNLVTHLINSLATETKTELVLFKTKLSLHDAFFDGSIQRDAFECFDMILDILHRGTKQNLIDFEDGLIEESLVTSITKQLFWHIINKSLSCNSCGHNTNSQQYAHFVTVEPCADICIQELIKHSLTIRIHMTCYACVDDRIILK